MNDNEQLIDQSQLAKDVAERIQYEFVDSFLVKPLDKIMVKKEVTKLPEGEPVKDAEGVEAVEGEPETEVKEVESDYKRGIILKTPITYRLMIEREAENGQYAPHYEAGDVVIYKQITTCPFDLIKNSVLIKSHNIVAKERNDNNNRDN